MVAFSNIVIAGGGVIGNSIAYFLAKRGTSVTIIDPVGIAPAASGKAGGFLAKDWRDGTVLGDLQRRSFDLHAELAKEFDGTDYRRLTAAGVEISEGEIQKAPCGEQFEGVEWVDGNAVSAYKMGDESTVAQVHPKKFCDALWGYSKSKAGSKLHFGRVKEAIVEEDTIKGVRLEDGTIIEADALVVACGPWTDEARSWFPGSKSVLPEITGTKYHSILVPSPKRVLNQAVFFEGGYWENEDDPEIYPRPDGDAYICGIAGEETVVTERPGEEEVFEEDVEWLKDFTSYVSTELGGIDPHTTQSCYLPTTEDGFPVIGPIPGIMGAYVAGGHSCWGILNGPATGEAMAELLLDGKTTEIDIRPFGVERLLE
mmetsp:Transcript_39859/g.58553  ORF Transcript_39859/g.58553 Transcript_39859/m.58553 type:complete len:371 (+) Transcript_39859:165-1277(+)